jgi:hypothetical protein
MTNLNLESAQVREGLRNAWNAREESAPIPMQRIQTLIDQRYGQRAWTEKF